MSPAPAPENPSGTTLERKLLRTNLLLTLMGLGLLLVSLAAILWLTSR